jgi:hypothetical protein
LPHYIEADLIVDTENMSPEQVARKIVLLLQTEI